MKNFVTLLVVASAFAAEPMLVVDDRLSLALNTPAGCATLVKVIPLPVNRAPGGWFSTTATNLSLRDLTMVPTGTNVFEFRVVCRGRTSDVRRVVVDIQRRPDPPVIDIVVDDDGIRPPLPPGAAQPLPGGFGDSYADYVRRATSGARRSQ